MTPQGRFYQCHYNVDGTYASSNTQSGSKIDADSGTKCADGIDAIGSQFLRCNNVQPAGNIWHFSLAFSRVN